MSKEEEIIRQIDELKQVIKSENPDNAKLRGAGIVATVLAPVFLLYVGWGAYNKHFKEQPDAVVEKVDEESRPRTIGLFLQP